MPTPNKLSIAKLEQLLDRHKTRLSSLHRRRDQLQKRLEKLEVRITSLSGSNGATMKSVSRRLRKRPKNAKSLNQAVTEILSGSKSGYALVKLADKVLATGYKTHSADFKNVLYQMLYNHPQIVYDAASGNYRLNGGAH